MRRIRSKRSVGTGIIVLGVLGVGFVFALALLRGPALPGGYAGAVVVGIPAGLFGFTGYLFRRWSPVVAEKVDIGDAGIAFHGDGRVYWTKTWTDRPFTLTSSLYPAVPSSTKIPWFGIRVHDGDRSSYITTSVYEAILAKARSRDSVLSKVFPCERGNYGPPSHPLGDPPTLGSSRELTLAKSL